MTASPIETTLAGIARAKNFQCFVSFRFLDIKRISGSRSPVLLDVFRQTHLRPQRFCFANLGWTRLMVC